MRRDRRDGRMADSLLALLSRDWIGVPVAVLVAGAGGGWPGRGWFGRRRSAPWRWLSVCCWQWEPFATWS